MIGSILNYTRFFNKRNNDVKNSDSVFDPFGNIIKIRMDDDGIPNLKDGIAVSSFLPQHCAKTWFYVPTIGKKIIFISRLSNYSFIDLKDVPTSFLDLYKKVLH